MWWLALVSGCVVTSGQGSTGDSGSEPGTLSLTWSVGAMGCEAAGVTEIEVALGSVRERLPCADGGAVVSGPSGRYAVVATGFYADGAPRYEGTATVDVTAGAQTTGHVTLAALPAALEVSWYFQNGRLCAANGVTDVHLVLFDDDDFVVAETSLPCEEGLTSLEGLVSGTFGVLAEGLDEAGALAFRGASEVVLGKGETAVVELELGAP